MNLASFNFRGNDWDRASVKRSDDGFLAARMVRGRRRVERRVEDLIFWAVEEGGRGAIEGMWWAG